jgi:predicted HicB family RNase H-like nuclease
VTTPFGFGDFGNQFLEQQPRAAFESFDFGQSPGQKRFFQNQFSNIHNQFLGSLAQQARAGQIPQGTFSGSFLPRFNPRRHLALTSPAFRGTARESQFNPRTRSLFF